MKRHNNENHRWAVRLREQLAVRLFLVTMFGFTAACGSKAPAEDVEEKNTHPGDPVDGGVDAGQGTADAGSEANAVPAVCQVMDPSLAELNAEELFNYPYVPTFDIYLPADEWTLLQENARDEQYTKAEVCFEGKGLGLVGLRFKGAYGSLLNCFDENDVNICRKLGMKLKFSEYELEKRFYRLKRLNLQGNRYDDSYMKEKLAYDMYRSMDIVAPRILWANVRVNGELMGLYGMVEQVDGRFTTDRWPENPDANLYKEIWPNVEDEDSTYVISKLKTNKDISDVSAFMGFAKAMRDAEPNALRDTLGNFVDLDYMARYMAVDDAIANSDGITAYYSSPGGDGAGNHNFYFYEDSPSRFTIIPWDLEATFSPGDFGNLPRWTEIPEDCSKTYNAWGQEITKVIAPGCDRVFQAIAADLEPYRQAGQVLLEGAFTEEAVIAQVDKHVAFIRDSVEVDPNGPTMAAFETATNNLKSGMEMLRLRFEALLSGEPLTPIEFVVGEITDFETQDELGLIIGTAEYTASGSDSWYTLNTENPMFGAKSLVINFEFGNTSEPWDQWTNYLVPIRGGQTDVTAMTGIRFWARSNRERELRLELDNPYVSAANDWLREGWFVDLTEEPTQIEVLFAEADIPYWGYDAGQEPMAELQEVLGAVKGILLSPRVVGAESTGFLPEGTVDAGFVEIDNFEFF